MSGLEIIFFMCLFMLPFPVAFLYALIKRANKFLIITPLVIFVGHMLSICWLFYWSAELMGEINYLIGCFITAIIGTVGIYYGFLKRQYHLGGGMGTKVLGWFFICFTIMVFPPILAGLLCWAVHTLHVPTEKVVKERPELGKRPSWDKVVKEKENKKEGGG